jgi:hypothetical protein
MICFFFSTLTRPPYTIILWGYQSLELAEEALPKGFELELLLLL